MSLHMSAPFNSNPKSMPYHRRYPTSHLSARKDEVDPPEDEDDVPYTPVEYIEPYGSDDGPLYPVEEDEEPTYPQEGGYPSTTIKIMECSDAMNSSYIIGGVLIAAVILIVTMNQNCGKSKGPDPSRGAFRGSDVASEEVIQRMLNF